MSMLRELDEEYCQCPFGAAGREVGYSCPGTCLDYVYDELNTSYAFAFEIYVGQDFRELGLKQGIRISLIFYIRTSGSFSAVSTSATKISKD